MMTAAEIRLDEDGETTRSKAFFEGCFAFVGIAGDEPGDPAWETPWSRATCDRERPSMSTAVMIRRAFDTCRNVADQLCRCLGSELSSCWASGVSGGLVVPGGVEGEVAEYFSGGGV
jgi:hypothetical protein